jgi:hypothetical protein
MSGLVGGSISQIHSNAGPVTAAHYPRLRDGPSAPAPDFCRRPSEGTPADGDADERRRLPVAGTVHQVLDRRALMSCFVGVQCPPRAGA